MYLSFISIWWNSCYWSDLASRICRRTLQTAEVDMAMRGHWGSQKTFQRRDQSGEAPDRQVYSWKMSIFFENLGNFTSGFLVEIVLWWMMDMDMQMMLLIYLFLFFQKYGGFVVTLRSSKISDSHGTRSWRIEVIFTFPPPKWSMWLLLVSSWLPFLI